MHAWRMRHSSEVESKGQMDMWIPRSLLLLPLLALYYVLVDGSTWTNQTNELNNGPIPSQGFGRFRSYRSWSHGILGLECPRGRAPPQTRRAQLLWIVPLRPDRCDVTGDRRRRRTTYSDLNLPFPFNFPVTWPVVVLQSDPPRSLQLFAIIT